MVLVIIIIISALCICFSIILYIIHPKSYNKISFKETLDLTDLPIVTFEQNGNKINFLLDTGANRSVINKAILPNYTYTELGANNTLSGLDGIKRVVDNINMNINYGDAVFEETFQVSDLSPVFDSIKQETGATLHGILGNAFFQKYKYVIDFNSLMFYSRKK